MQSKKISSPHLQILLRVAVLAAMDVLLMNYLGIHTQYFKIGFSFVPIALCGMLYGAKWSTACAGLGDLINCHDGSSLNLCKLQDVAFYSGSRWSLCPSSCVLSVFLPIVLRFPDKVKSSRRISPKFWNNRVPNTTTAAK